MTTIVRGSLASGAVFSSDGQYRYLLWRRWDERPAATFVLLNPSIATEDVSDPTLRRCTGYARAWGFGGAVLANLFALRSRDPRALARACDPVGPENDAILCDAVDRAGIVVCGWGVRGALGGRDAAVCALLVGRPLHILGVTRGGQPRHPLYLRAGLRPASWTPAWRPSIPALPAKSAENPLASECPAVLRYPSG